MQPGILCTGIGQSQVLHSNLASNLLESASERRENIPPLRNPLCRARAW